MERPTADGSVVEMSSCGLLSAVCTEHSAAGWPVTSCCYQKLTMAMAFVSFMLLIAFIYLKWLLHTALGIDGMNSQSPRKLAVKLKRSG